MATKLQKKQQKQKAKDKENRKKILANRAKTRAKAKEEKDEFRRDKRIKRLLKDMEGLDTWEEETLKEMPDKTFDQLEHNAQILKVLEEEHEQDMAAKKELNEGLEEKGHITLDEKLNALHQSTLEQQKKGKGIQGSAECRLTIAPVVPKDTAEVEVLKAPSVDEEEITEDS